MTAHTQELLRDVQEQVNPFDRQDAALGFFQQHSSQAQLLCCLFCQLQTFLIPRLRDDGMEIFKGLNENTGFMKVFLAILGVQFLIVNAGLAIALTTTAATLITSWNRQNLRMLW